MTDVGTEPTCFESESSDAEDLETDDDADADPDWEPEDDLDAEYAGEHLVSIFENCLE
ncbi:hypothetical protein DPMN_106710 [Dreissena polymorpha]|uniref:Uncharacterized protein n=1 Tax=Dreissena polymorpha TaxID=45954 RepID=A0A9D4K5H9_DREPO|nr:hypothetical protein DPMN_106710 [Dreissena polymorpha]